MKKSLLAGLAVGALALGAPAYATDYRKEGGCSYTSTNDPIAGQGQQTGMIVIDAVVYATDPAHNPVTATITCYITVNGSPQPGATLSATGTTFVYGGGVITYTRASVTDDVKLCETVEYWGPGGGSTTTECDEATTFEIPPPIVWEIVDPAVCPVFSAINGTYGPVFINIQGDIYIDGEPFFDCPPYDIIWP